MANIMDAYTNIQVAVDSATGTETILVAAGKYLFASAIAVAKKDHVVYDAIGNIKEKR